MRERVEVLSTAEAGRLPQMLNTVKHTRVDQSDDAELRKLVALDLLVLDDFAHV